MTLTHILAFFVFALITGQVVPARFRTTLILFGSVLGVYWMQPSTPVRNLDFWLPTVSIVLVVLVWAITRPVNSEEQTARLLQRRSLAAGLLILGAVLTISLTRYVEPLCCLTPTRPPGLLQVALALGIGGVAAAIPARVKAPRQSLSCFFFILLVALLVILKSEALSRTASALLRGMTGQQPGLASALDLPWLGFSYLSFRLLHVLRDYQAGKLPAYSLGEFASYALFFPAYTAGPIDRSQHFIVELQQDCAETAGGRTWLCGSGSDLAAGTQRILWGVFKKFAVADTLAIIALSPQNAVQVQSTLWAWVLLYAYALRIYFDFSGYTDIALGLARLMGIRLPENFDRPYLRQNLTSFWNGWHITLTQWIRMYFFNPFTRFLRTGSRALPAWAVILAAQMGTMLLIGLWHGITWNFAIWGAWHGLGLFIHNRWLNYMRSQGAFLQAAPRLQRVLNLGSWFLTFHYVTLGWIWFALPDTDTALKVLANLFGIG